jgi:4-amino-4-deoxy-L-arabinose transferase-like glycosyltransferase
VALGLTLTVPSLFTRDLWNPDEPRYAEIAREMRLLGDYLVPHLGGEIYAEKPPLFFWLSAILQAWGAGLVAGRIVSAAAAIGTLLVTRALARLWFPERTATAAALILGSSFLFAWVGRVGVLDVPLAFCTTLAVYGFHRHRRDGGPWIALYYAGMGLATLTKGPVGILVPVLAAASSHYAGLPRRARAARHPHLLWGPLLTAGIVAAWLVPALHHGGAAYADTILYRQNLGRIVSSWSHRQPWYYYLENLPPCFYPWIVFVPWAVVDRWRHPPRADRARWRGLVLWLGAGLIVFSLISGKRERYLLPLFPPLAILVAGLLERALEPGPSRDTRSPWFARLFLITHGSLALVGLGPLALALVGAGPFTAREGIHPQVEEALRELLGPPGRLALAVAAAGLVAAGIAGLRAAARGRLERAFGLVVVAIAVLSLGFDLVLARPLDRLKSPRPLALQLNALAPPDTPDGAALYLTDFSGAYHVYSGRLHLPVLGSPAEAERFLSSSPGGVILATREDFERDAPKIRAPHRVIPGRRVGHREMVFLVTPHE